MTEGTGHQFDKARIKIPVERLAQTITREEEYMWAILSELRAIRQMLERTDVTRRGLYGEAG